MLMTERDRLAATIKSMADKLGANRTSLIPILLEVKRKYHRIDSYAMQVIGDLLGIHPVEVHSVVSFYAFLGDHPQGRFVIRLCRTISCDMQGKSRVQRQLENDLGIHMGETTADGSFTLEWANCMGMCDQGPALLVNDRLFTRVTPEKVHQILEECRSVFGVHAAESKEVHVV
jgi:[NiFe] hydrogenase diaphorase moiety large subunit